MGSWQVQDAKTRFSEYSTPQSRRDVTSAPLGLNRESFQIGPKSEPRDAYVGDCATLRLGSVGVDRSRLDVVAVMFSIYRGRTAEVQFTTPYQAVLLSNGSAYFGKLEGYGGRHPVLTQVYYVVRQTNSDTKQVNNVLVRRGKELHEPDRMYINPGQIVAVEPVGPHSKVAELMGQANQ